MPEATDYQALAEQIRSLASQLGFQQLGISAPDIGQHEQWLEQWLKAGYHGEMEWMSSLSHTSDAADQHHCADCVGRRIIKTQKSNITDP